MEIIFRIAIDKYKKNNFESIEQFFQDGFFEIIKNNLNPEI